MANLVSSTDNFVAGSGITLTVNPDGTITIAGGGGGGGTTDGTNLAPIVGSIEDIGGGYAGYTFLLTFPGRSLTVPQSAVTKFKISISPTNANTKIANSVLYQVTQDTRTVVSVTPITWNSGASFPVVVAGTGTQYSDEITFTIDNTFDYIIAVFTDASTSNSQFSGWHASNTVGISVLPDANEVGVFVGDESSKTIGQTVALGSAGALRRSAITGFFAAV